MCLQDTDIAGRVRGYPCLFILQHTRPQPSCFCLTGRRGQNQLRVGEGPGSTLPLSVLSSGASGCCPEHCLQPPCFWVPPTPGLQLLAGNWGLGSASEIVGCCHRKEAILTGRICSIETCFPCAGSGFQAPPPPLRTTGLVSCSSGCFGPRFQVRHDLI